MNTETTSEARTDHLDVTISSDEHVAIINMAGERNWRYVRLATELIEAAVQQTKSIEGNNIEADTADPKSFTISVPVSQLAKIKLINLVGGKRIAYTTVASRLLKEAIQAEMGLRHQRSAAISAAAN